MIITVTPNPSLDLAIALSERLEIGSVLRAEGDRTDAGGKGVNVSRALAAAGIPTRAIFPAAADDPFVGLVEASGVPAAPIPVQGRVRTNITLVDPDGTTTKINLPGDESVARAHERVLENIVGAGRGAAWLVLAGSLPPGLGADFFAIVSLAVRERWGDDAPRIAIDTSGLPLRAVVETAHPDLIKPNGEELADLLGEDPGSDAEEPLVALERARRVVPSRAEAALVTLGARGALLVTASGALFAAAPRITVRSTVGAGDSSLAGYLVAEQSGSSPADRLARAVAYGAVAASLPGTQPPTPAEAALLAITVTDWSAGAPLVP